MLGEGSYGETGVVDFDLNRRRRFDCVASSSHEAIELALDAWSDEKENYFYKDMLRSCTPQECGNYVQVTEKLLSFSHRIIVPTWNTLPPDSVVGPIC